MSFRSDLIIRRTYNRPLNDEGTIFETWSQTVDRVIEHQKWLWERQLTINKTGALKNIENSSDWVYLNDNQLQELNQLRKLILNKKASVAGRTLWLGGTDVAKKRASSQFNCSFLDIETINDLVDAFWLLLQGCGVGFKPKVGTLTGFNTQIKTIETIPSKQNSTKGRENNEEIYDTTPDGKHHWYLSIGDSAEAWAKSVGKLLAMKKPVDVLTIDFSEIRKEGTRLKGYGWISQGYKNLETAILAICNILNKRADSLLSAIDILDIVNWLGTVLSSRRCLPGETAVYTSKGIQYIEDIKVGDLVYDSKGVKQKVTNVFVQGEQELLIIQSQIADFRCTPNHKVAVLNSIDSYEWKEAQYLKPGDRLVAPYVLMEWDYKPLPLINNITEDKRSTKYTIPELDTDFAWFLGYFIGNGSVPESKKIGLSNISVAIPNVEGLYQRVYKQLERLGCHITVREPREDDNCYKILITNKNLATWFKTYIKPNGSENAEIPDFIKNNTSQIRSAFMAGLLDSDGTIGRPISAVYTVSENLIKDSYEVLASLGIHGRVRTMKRKEVKWKTIRALQIVGDFTKEKWFNLMKPHSFKVQTTEFRFDSQNSFGFPSEWLKGYKQVGWASNSAQMTVGRFIAAGNEFKNLIPITVTSVIKDQNKDLTYDIEVENVHEFIAGPGILVHNSAQIALLEDTHTEATDFMYAKKEYWTTGNVQRAQSNNSIEFTSKPSKEELHKFFDAMIESGGSEPGAINSIEARRRAPYFRGVNPLNLAA